jgi:hypothetical protein
MAAPQQSIGVQFIFLNVETTTCCVSFQTFFFYGVGDSNSILILNSDGSVFSRGLFALKTGICILKPNHISGASNAKSKENMG